MAEQATQAGHETNPSASVIAIFMFAIITAQSGGET
jgi:hypothetical protein